MFIDRKKAGELLAKKLLEMHYTADTVIGLVHGGVIISSEISHELGIPHDVLSVKKIGSPGNPELATGARVRSGQTLDVRNKTIIMADDGAATGATMTAAIRWVKQHHAKHVIVALPVAPPDVVVKLRLLVDDVVVLETPLNFEAVGQYYRNFRQITDADVIQLLS